MKVMLKTDDNSQDFEALILQIYNKKYYLIDFVNPNIKIKIIKNIPIEDDYGFYLLNHLGYDNDYDRKIILECQYITKKNCFFNKYKNVLFIISFNNYNITMYKFNKINNDYKYVLVAIQK